MTAILPDKKVRKKMIDSIRGKREREIKRERERDREEEREYIYIRSNRLEDEGGR